MTSLCIVGTGSQARYVIENCANNPSIKIEGLVDLEKSENVGKTMNGVEIKCHFNKIKEKFDPKFVQVIVAYGHIKKKMDITRQLIEMDYTFYSAISSRAYISSHVDIGIDTIINPNVTIMPNTKIGNHVIVHSNCVIEHDNIIEDFANIGPGVSTAGNVRIGSGTYVYTGSSVIPKIHIGKNVIIGAGSVVTKNVPDLCTFAGVPAKKIKDGM